jgi:predicted transposase/invertase (TIGR01784 family)
MENGIMTDFLEQHGSEVNNMIFTEFNMDDAKVIWREEGLEEGLEKGREETKEYTAVRMLHGGMEPDLVAKYTDLPLEKTLRLSEGITQH